MKEAILGCLLGTAVGDAMGLVCEGLTPKRRSRLYPDLSLPHLLPGRGMVSDDTEHTCMVAQALIVSAGEVNRFTSHLAHELRLWLLSIPAGIGFATLRATGKLCVGISPDRSGVFSAGNGPAMRTALIGVCYGQEPERMRHLIQAATWITHTDPKAEYGAQAVAIAAHLNASQRLTSEALEESLHQYLGPEADEFHALIAQVVESIQSGQETTEFALALGLHRGVSGYVYHSVPVALHAALRHPQDVRAAITAAIHCGGDTDTTAAIVGGIVGAGAGRVGIPVTWMHALWEWPHSVPWMERLGERLTEVVMTHTPQPPLSSSRLLQLPRNGIFLALVLAHGFRRLLPPY